MSPPERLNTFAAVDLGSNSFHLLVARRSHGELRVLDRIKETVRLGGGLDRQGKLDSETRNLALDCLARFGQRLRGIPDENVRAVGTQTLRKLRNSNEFLAAAETALGRPVDIIAGREEARLIYLGVSQGVSGHTDRRLVIDIGGGSTELIIGEGLETRVLESIQFGCVSLTRWFFGDGRNTRKRWNQAMQAALAELQELQKRYREIGWASAIGSSGTIRAIATICRAMDWTEKDITANSLAQLRDRLIGFGSFESIDLPALSEERKGVLVGGTVMLTACFEALGIGSMADSPFALREGVLHDLLGRLENRDPRDKTVEAFQLRYGVDKSHSERVARVAAHAYTQVRTDRKLVKPHARLLKWAADLHETGLGISHSRYQVHSRYLVAESDMPGFSRQEQLFLSALVGFHRRPITHNWDEGLPARLREPLRHLLFLIRLSWMLCRTRDDAALPEFRIVAGEDAYEVFFPEAWMNDHPLTIADLEQERTLLSALGLRLTVSARESCR